MATGRIGVTPTLGTRWSKAPAGGTTSLSGLDDNSVSLVYSVGYEQVYRNGVLLSRGNDYTATTGNSITLIDATIAGDIIEVFANELVPLTDAISKGQFTAKGALLSATAASTPAVLTVGSNDQVLTADSSTATGLKWATPVTGSMTLLSTTTLSGATTTISSISGSYKDLVAVVYGVTNATADGIFQLRPNAATTGCFGLVSRGTGWIGNGNNEVYLTPSSSGSGETISRSSSANAFCITISNYASTAAIKPIFSFGQYADTGASPRLAGIYIGGYNSTSAITSLVFLNSGGNLSTGTVLLYGVN